MIWGFLLGSNIYERNGNKPLVAYKYINSSDLHFWLKDDSIKIDTLSTYAGLESQGGVGDPQEIFYKETTSFYVQNEHKNSTLEANLKALIGDKHFKSDCFFVANNIKLPNRYIYCLSTKFDRDSFLKWNELEGYDCVIKIKDISSFLLEIQKADLRSHRRLGAPAYVDLVDYVKTPIDLESYYLGDENKLGMIKDTQQFEWQSELRVRWHLPPHFQSNPYFLKVENLVNLIEVVDIPLEWLKQ